MRTRSGIVPPRAVALALALLVAGSAARPAGAQPPAEGEWSIPAPLAPVSLLLDAQRRGERIVAVGERGHVLRSHDGGVGWTQERVPSRALLTAVWMHDDRLGWAVGHDETILRTADGGATWERVRFEPEAERPLLDVWFRDAEHGFAVGAYGAFLVSEDGGATWEERPISADDYHLNRIAVAPDGGLYLAAEAGHFYRSDDGGETWIGLEPPYQGSYFGALPLADGALLVFGLRGHVLRSEDRGATWSEIETGTEATLMAGAELDDGRVLLTGLAGAVLRSDDGGLSFRSDDLEDRRARVAIVPLEGAALLFGEGGVHRLEGTP